MTFLKFSQLSESVFRPNFSLTDKIFPLTNFTNDKQTHKSLDNGFSKTTFRETKITLTILELRVFYNDILEIKYIILKDILSLFFYFKNT